MKKGAYTTTDLLCDFCNEKSKGLCSSCRKPVCEKHAEFRGEVLGCKKCQQAGFRFTEHVAVNETPLWFDYLTYRFIPALKRFIVVSREQYNKFRCPRPGLHGKVLDVDSEKNLVPFYEVCGGEHAFEVGGVEVFAT